ncbi:hypothetical protein JR316_0013139 [Psilocybe cubensis]|uniref:Uncharacterized protein n=2 Tax=Psilocybe cubensis TaxID=181762 RepID=A0ACB8GGW6_PSICU|nr:hypothetical protein JR316_0013139 [Psilocybe cubensis]KAH9474675.1 hypothetical protein JR316_0013139 [Psilocybe cubensis]
MLLKLIPALSEPTIHFSLSFSDLPYNLPTPAAWTSQLAQLMHEDLETPTTLHSLDRSAGVTSLLEEVELDVALGEVRCRFIDGKVERWGFWEGISRAGAFRHIDGEQYGKRLSDALEKIVKDVHESTLEDERVLRERAWEKQKVERNRSFSSVTAASVAKVSSGSSKPTKHKKSRSFFMQIVSAVGSIINLSSPASPSSNATSFFSSRPSTSQAWPTPTSPPSTTAPTGTSPRARALRRSARSSLVDTYRLYVLTELVRRIAGPTISIDTLEADSSQEDDSQEYRRQDPTNFCVWILHSMRRRMLERMDQILEEAEAELASDLSTLDAAPNSDVQEDTGLETTTMIVPVSFSDDEDEPTKPPPLSATPDDSDSDDGSSVHTPSTTSHFQCYPGIPSTRTSSRSSNVSSHSSHSDEHELLSASPTPPVPPKDLPEAQPSVQPSTSRQRPTIRLLVSQPAQPVPPVQRLSTAALEEYRYLMDSRKRLAQLLLFAASQSRVANEEARSRLDVLAVRSRRRAWSNRALSMEAKSRTGLGGSAAYGLATPFRSSALARYMWTAEDLACGSGSADSSPASSLSRCSGLGFPPYRPRLRPKIRHDVEAVLGIEMHGDSLVDDEEGGPFEEESLADAHPAAAERDIDMYAGIKGAMHEKRVTTRKVSISTRAPAPEKSRSVIGRLFPVTEEREVEVQDHYPNDDQVYEFALHGRTTYKKEQTHTFMGCDEVRVESEDEEEIMYAFNGDDDEDHHEFDVESGFSEFGDREVPHDVDSSMAGVEVVQRPKAQKTRSTSRMGAFLQRAKGMQSSFQSNSRQLTKDSLLCQGVPASVVVPSSPAPLKKAFQLQTQSQARFKRTDPPVPAYANEKAIKIARTSSAAIYTNIEVDMLDIQVYDPDSTDYAQYKNEPLNGRPAISPKSRSQTSKASQDEFTLSMDVQKRSSRKRREGSRQFDYPTKPLGRHEFDEPRRPKLDAIFTPSARSGASSKPKLSC